MAKAAKNIIKTLCNSLLIVCFLILSFFAGKRVYYSNRKYLYRFSYFRPVTESGIRYNNFLKSKPDSAEIIFIGTSLTAGFPLQRAFNNIHIKNLGFGGDRTFNELREVKKYIKRKPKKMFLEVGINDFRAGMSPDTVFKNFVKIYGIIKKGAPLTKLYVQSVLPTATENLNKAIREYDQKIESFCRQDNITYINLYPAFASNGRIDSSLTVDGIHLNGKGYSLWRKGIERFVLE